MSLQAGFKEGDACAIIRFLFKFKRAAVLHEFFKFTWLASAELFERCLDLFLFDRVVFFVLATPRKALPW